MIIEAKGIKKNYNGEPCLKGIDLNVEKGRFLTVMGASGSGKTTLLEILAGIRLPDEGSVKINGKDVFSMPDREIALMRHTYTGIVYQNFSLIDTLSAMDNIILPLALSGKKKGAEELAKSWAERLNIPLSALGKFPCKLSGGQQQRVALARALIYEPELLFLDEPTGSLDTKNTFNVLDILKEVNDNKGTTIIQITHSKEAAEYVCDPCDILHIKDGVILQ